MMLKLVELAQKTIAAVLKPGDVAIDATVGNGFDTLFLARSVAPGGFVYGVDIQAEAIAITRNKLHEQGMETHCQLVVANHADLDRIIETEHRNRIQAVMFNLGYLPRGNQHITTTAQCTLAALASACSRLGPGGRVSVVCYTGHPGGRLETEQVNQFASTLPEDFQITVHQPERTIKPAPQLVVIERARAGPRSLPTTLR
ncbi:MAG: class I SAM-dependent methyltransferase [Methylococcales bacterium]